MLILSQNFDFNRQIAIDIDFSIEKNLILPVEVPDIICWMQVLFLLANFTEMFDLVDAVFLEFGSTLGKQTA